MLLLSLLTLARLRGGTCVRSVCGQQGLTDLQPSGGGLSHWENQSEHWIWNAVNFYDFYMTNAMVPITPLLQANLDIYQKFEEILFQGLENF